MRYKSICFGTITDYFIGFLPPEMTIEYSQVPESAIQMILANPENWALSSHFTDEESKAQRR